MCEGVILACCPSSCSPSNPSGNFDYANENSHSQRNNFVNNVNNNSVLQSQFVAMELLAQLKYRIDMDELPVIRISFAYAPTEEMAMAFLRDVDKDRVQIIKVYNHSCCDYESQSSGATTTNSSGAFITSRKDFSSWNDFIMHAICPLVNGDGLLDTFSNLRVHEGLLLPIRSKDVVIEEDELNARPYYNKLDYNLQGYDSNSDDKQGKTLHSQESWHEEEAVLEEIEWQEMNGEKKHSNDCCPFEDEYQNVSNVGMGPVCINHKMLLLMCALLALTALTLLLFVESARFRETINVDNFHKVFLIIRHKVTNLEQLSDLCYKQIRETEDWGWCGRFDVLPRIKRLLTW